MAARDGDGEGSLSREMDDLESLISMTDVERLKTAWRQEKAAPEIFQFEAALIQRVKEQIQLMVCPQSFQNPNLCLIPWINMDNNFVSNFLFRS